MDGGRPESSSVSHTAVLMWYIWIFWRSEPTVGGVILRSMPLTTYMVSPATAKQPAGPTGKGVGVAVVIQDVHVAGLRHVLAVVAASVPHRFAEKRLAFGHHVPPRGIVLHQRIWIRAASCDKQNIM